MQQHSLVRLSLVTATLAQYSRESFAILVLAGILPSGWRGFPGAFDHLRLQAPAGISWCGATWTEGRQSG